MRQRGKAQRRRHRVCFPIRWRAGVCCVWRGRYCGADARRSIMAWRSGNINAAHECQLYHSLASRASQIMAPLLLKQNRTQWRKVTWAWRQAAACRGRVASAGSRKQWRRRAREHEPATMAAARGAASGGAAKCLASALAAQPALCTGHHIARSAYLRRVLRTARYDVGRDRPMA